MSRRLVIAGCVIGMCFSVMGCSGSTEKSEQPEASEDVTEETMPEISDMQADEQSSGVEENEEPEEQGGYRTITLGAVPVSFECSDADYNIFVKGCLEEDQLSLQRVSQTKDEIESYMGNLEVVILDKEDDFENGKYWVGMEAAENFSEGTDFKEMDEKDPSKYLQYFDFGSEISNAELFDTAFALYVKYKDTEIDCIRYLTIVNGTFLNVSVGYGEGYESVGDQLAQELMNGFFVPENSQQAEDETDQDGWNTYTLENGTISIQIPESYDVFLQENPQVDQETADKYGIPRENIEQYIRMVSYKMLAVPESGTIAEEGDGNIMIRVKEKADYQSIYNFKDFSRDEKETMAETIAASFNSEVMDWTSSDTVESFGMEVQLMSKEIRYVTFLDGKIIYLIQEHKDGVITEEDRELMKSIAESMEFLQ